MLIRVNFRFQDFVLPFFLPTLASGYKGKLKQPLNTGRGQSFSPAFAQMPSSCLVPGKVCGVCWVGVGLVCTSAVVFCWHAYAGDHGCSHCLYLQWPPFHSLLSLCVLFMSVPPGNSRVFACLLRTIWQGAGFCESAQGPSLSLRCYSLTKLDVGLC